MNGVFIVGVDTGVGKTFVCAGVLKLLHGYKKACYWKPVQTNTLMGDDTSEIKTLTSLGADAFIEPAFRFPEPLAPYLAAQKWGKKVELSNLMSTVNQAKADGKFMIVEGGGGLLVPYSDTLFQVDLIKETGFPVILVAQDRVGAINQSLLSLNELRRRNLPILGMIITKSRGTFGNVESIKKFGNVDILIDIAHHEDRRTLVAEIGASEKLRQAFEIPALPNL